MPWNFARTREGESAVCPTSGTFCESCADASKWSGSNAFCSQNSWDSLFCRICTLCFISFDAHKRPMISLNRQVEWTAVRRGKAPKGSDRWDLMGNPTVETAFCDICRHKSRYSSLFILVFIGWIQNFSCLKSTSWLLKIRRFNLKKILALPRRSSKRCALVPLLWASSWGPGAQHQVTHRKPKSGLPRAPKIQQTPTPTCSLPPLKIHRMSFKCP